MTGTDYSSLISLIPSAIQAGTGVAQAVKGNQMGRGLTDPTYKIPQSAVDALTMYRTQAGRLTPAGYDNFVNQLSQIQGAATSSINRAATSAPQALGASLNAAGQQTKALQDYQGFAEQDYQRRQNELADALRMMSGYEDKRFGINVLDPFKRKADAAASLVGAGMQNTFAGLSDIAGSYATQKAAQEERAYQEKRDQQKWDRYRALTNQPMTQGVAVDTATPNNISTEAQAALDAYLNQGFENYGDAFSSYGTGGFAGTKDYTPRSNKSEFYTPQ